MLRKSLAIGLITHERITTTVAKAKWLRPFVEHLVTMARPGTLTVRRRLLSILNDKTAAHKLVDELGKRFAQRPGGYLRITKTGPRKGDGAEMAVIEFVERAGAASTADRKTKKAKPVKAKKTAAKETADKGKETTND